MQEQNRISVLPYGKKAISSIRKLKTKIIGELNSIDSNSFSTYPLEFISDKEQEQLNFSREYIIILDLSDKEALNQVINNRVTSIFTVINLFAEEDDLEKYPFSNKCSNIYIKDDDTYALQKVLVMLIHVIQPSVSMGDMLESFDLKEVMGNKKFITDHITKANSEQSLSVNKLADIISHEDYKCYSQILLFIFFHYNSSLFDINNLMLAVYERSDENTDIVHCNIEYKQKTKEETAELIILKGL